MSKNNVRPQAVPQNEMKFKSYYHDILVINAFGKQRHDDIAKLYSMHNNHIK